MRTFEINVGDDVLSDLRERLSRRRVLSDSPGRPETGLSMAYLGELAANWEDFDWRAREVWLNSHPQFVADVNGTGIHFAHLRSADADAPAILVMHGWPHTFALQLDFADLLPDFHVVVPSFPGFAFSAPFDGSMSERALAETMHTLMTQTLGYSEYLTYGEDISANVNDLIASSYPESVLGIIATHAHLGTDQERAAETDPEIVAFLDRLAAEGAANGGYAHVQATRPDTLAAALNDSPLGLLAWLVEKLVEWSDTPTGEPRRLEEKISRERILTEATIYWVTQSIGTSFRPYFDSGAEEPIAPVVVPAAVAIQRHEHDYPEALARRFYRDLRSFNRLPVGGHFAIAEVPADMAARTRAFAQSLGLLDA